MGFDPSNNARLREAVHFVCKKLALHPEKLGAVKLQKIIWYFDVKSFLVTRKTATGATFVKNNFGPYTTEIGTVIGELVAADRLFSDTEEFHRNEKARLIGKGPTDTSLFSERELRWLDEIATEISENHTANSISERSHGAVWRMAAYGEVIPFEATAISFVTPPAAAIDAIKKELGLA